MPDPILIYCNFVSAASNGIKTILTYQQGDTTTEIEVVRLKGVDWHTLNEGDAIIIQENDNGTYLISLQ